MIVARGGGAKLLAKISTTPSTMVIFIIIILFLKKILKYFSTGTYSWTEDSVSPTKDFDHYADILILCFVRGTDRERWSTCPLVFFSWLLDHVTYLKLKKKWLFAKLNKFTKWQLLSLKMTTFFTQDYFELSFCEFSSALHNIYLFASLR